MNTLIVLLGLALGIGLLLWLRRDENGQEGESAFEREGPFVVNYSALTRKAEKRAAIAGATSLEELDAMWSAWEKVGHSRDGLLYAAVLRRRLELGADLFAQDLERLDVAEGRIKRGRQMPRITGKMKGA